MRCCVQYFFIIVFFFFSLDQDIFYKLYFFSKLKIRSMAAATIVLFQLKFFYSKMSYITPLYGLSQKKMLRSKPLSLYKNHKPLKINLGSNYRQLIPTLNQNQNLTFSFIFNNLAKLLNVSNVLRVNSQRFQSNSLDIRFLCQLLRFLQLKKCSNEALILVGDQMAVILNINGFV